MPAFFRMFVALCLSIASVAFALPAQAAVEVHFYSRELGSQFPHAFIIVEGTLEGTGERVSGNYGFTAIKVTPGMLLGGGVKGHVSSNLGADYIAKAERKFSVTIDDATYAKLMREVTAWKVAAQPSYSLNKRNCVHFIMELAATVGLSVNRNSKFFKKPRSFLEEVIALNRSLKR